MKFVELQTRHTVAGALFALTFALTMPALAGPNLETFVMATTGQETFHTTRAPDAVEFSFGGWGKAIPTNALSDPSILASDGVAGTYRVTDSTVAASLTDSTAISGSGLSTFGRWNYSGDTTVTAQYGQLKSESHAVHTGFGDNATINSAESYGICEETYTPNSSLANGTPATMVLAMTIDGNMSVSGIGGMGMLLRYGYGANPDFSDPAAYLLETTAYIGGNGYSIYGVHSSFGSFTTPPGMSYTVGPLLPSGAPATLSFGGTTTVYATVPCTFGSAVDVKFGLMTLIDPADGSGVMDANFAHTATLTGIQIFDSQGQNVPDFTITSGSGTFYDANGVHLSGAASAPEPSTIALLFCSTAIMAGSSLALPRTWFPKGVKRRKA